MIPSSETDSNDTLNGVAVTDLTPQVRQQYSDARAASKASLSPRLTQAPRLRRRG